MIKRTRILNVVRKPQRCPVCGGKVVEIVYGTGEMTESEFAMRYRRHAVMGGDTVPYQPPIWSCQMGCRRFRKVDREGRVVKVKVRTLKRLRPAPLSLITFTTADASLALNGGMWHLVKRYFVEVTTDRDEHELLNILATGETDACDQAAFIISHFEVGLHGKACVDACVTDTSDL